MNAFVSAFKVIIIISYFSFCQQTKPNTDVNLLGQLTNIYFHYF